MIYKTDWLASTPVFYNKKTKKISYNINDVIDFMDLQFHPEGLANYLDFGYSILGQTPINDVKFLRHSSQAWMEDGEIKIKENPDPVLKWLEDNPNGVNEEDLIKLIEDKTRDWENSVSGDIILPLSGGYDSRLLACMLKNKTRIKAFTFGVSKDQSISQEVAHAKEISKRLGIEWKQITLGDYHKYIQNWLDTFGLSVHAHGMYQLEFYNKVKDNVDKGSYVLSGIVGDAWAGSINKKRIESYKDLNIIGYTHGCNSNSKVSILKHEFELKKSFFKKNKLKLNNELTQIVEIIRFKIILLSYLMKLPEEVGLKSWSPFLDIDIAMGMLTLPSSRRLNRIWQKELFEKAGIDVENIKIKKSTSNRLNYDAMRNIELVPLREDLLSKIVSVDYVKKINRKVTKETLLDKITERIFTTPKLGGFIRRFLKIQNPKYKAYWEYLTLKPLEDALIKKERLENE